MNRWAPATVRLTVALLAALLCATLLGSMASATAGIGSSPHLLQSIAFDYDAPVARTTHIAGPRVGGTRVEPRAATRSQLSTHRTSPFVAAKAGDDALRTVTALTREQDAALAAAMRDPNKLRHIFGKPQHNLGPLTRELGGQEALMREAVLAVPRGTTGTFEVTKRIGTYDLTVRGRVVNGVPRIGTVFTP